MSCSDPAPTVSASELVLGPAVSGRLDVYTSVAARPSGLERVRAAACQSINESLSP